MMTNQRSTMSFQLMIRQQPLQSRVCGVGEKVDRRPIDPPLIVELTMISSSSRIQEAKEKCMTQLFLTAVLVPVASNPKIGDMTNANDDHHTSSTLDLALHAQLTVGRTVSSLYHFKDLDGQEKNFFVFSDLSIRVEGAYRFQLCLFQIIGSSVSFQQSILTDEFTVYSAKKFPGMFGSCPLARCFADQGLKIRIRNQSGPRQHRRRINPLSSPSSVTNRYRLRLGDGATTTLSSHSSPWQQSHDSTDDSPQLKKKKRRKNLHHHHTPNDSSTSSTSSSPSSSPTLTSSSSSVSPHITNHHMLSISSFLTTNASPPPPDHSSSSSAPVRPPVDLPSSSSSSSSSPPTSSSSLLPHNNHRLPSFSTFLQNMHPPS